MKNRQLGKDGPEVSAIGFGAWPVGGGMGNVDEKTAIATVRGAIDNGITLVDTARAYRTSEEMVGKALRDGYREKCFLATKCHEDYSRDGIARSLEASLRTMDVEYLDLFQLHHGSPDYPEESIAALAELRDQGKIGYFGVCNFSAAEMRTALGVARPQSNQIVYSLFDRGMEAEEIGQCEEEGIGIQGHSTLAKGLLTGRYSSTSQFGPDDERASQKPRFKGEAFKEYMAMAEQLQAIAQEKGISAAGHRLGTATAGSFERFGRSEEPRPGRRAPGCRRRRVQPGGAEPNRWNCLVGSRSSSFSLIEGQGSLGQMVCK